MDLLIDNELMTSNIIHAYNIPELGTQPVQQIRQQEQQMRYKEAANQMNTKTDFKKEREPIQSRGELLQLGKQ